jgi:cobalt/nickel transport system ATP-binding protein
MCAETLIRLASVHFGYHGGPEILKGVDLTLTDENRLGLVGSNGSGKTTVLSIIMGLLKPSDGQVEVLGRICKTEGDFKSLRPKLGFVFQDANDQLFCPTVFDDVAFGPLNLGASPEQARLVVEEVLESLNLKGFEHRVTYDLSGGEKKLVALATTLALKPKILILDEPTNFLDPQAVERLEEILLNSSLPFLIVSHDLSFLKRVTNGCSRLLDGLLSPL